MFLKNRLKKIGFFIAIALPLSIGIATYASHSWGSYHWARASNPFTVKLADNVSSSWDAYLAEASSDWNQSGVLDTSVIAGSTNPRLCRSTTGRVEVCNSKYGFNGWLGIASIWVSKDHITKGTVKLNDSYFNASTYNTPAWKRLVMCQEIAHTFGLNHQDEEFGNANLGSCMDYTLDPDGPPSNEHPNSHDYDQLDLIYAHLDSTATVKQTGFGRGNQDTQMDMEDWIKSKGEEAKEVFSKLEQSLSPDEKVFTFIIWAQS